MIRTLRLSAVVVSFAFALAVAGMAAAQSTAAPRRAAPERAGLPAPTVGVMPHALYPDPEEQARQAPFAGPSVPGANGALRDLYRNPADRLYSNPFAQPSPSPVNSATGNALRRLYGGRSALASPNLGASPGGASSAAPVSPTDPSFRRYDLNGNGTISADEYTAARMRAAPANPNAVDAERRRMLLERFDSRFRSADRNRDGRITPGEMGGVSNPRF